MGVARSESERFRTGWNGGVWAVWAALAATLVMNGLAVWLPLAGRSTGEISERFPVLLTPADYAFGVWSVIYLGLIAFAVYQARPGVRGRPAIARLRAPFVASCAFNVAWLVAWHNLWIGASMAFMAALWLSLAVLYARTRGLASGLRAADTWLAAAPFGLYFGWVTVASLVNVRVLLFDLGWTGGGGLEAAYTVLMLALVALVASWIAWRWRDGAFAGVAVWALIAVAVANGNLPAVAGVALAGALGIAVVLAVAWIRSRRPRTSP